MIRSYFFATYPTEKSHDLSFPSPTWEREKNKSPLFPSLKIRNTINALRKMRSRILCDLCLLLAQQKPDFILEGIK